MLHHVFGRKLNRTANERKRLFRNLTRSLILHGQINTTLAKAKAVQPLVEKLITKSRVADLTNRRFLLKQLNDQQVVNKLLTEIGPLFGNISGGYTRIIKLGNRLGDNAQSVVFTFTKSVSNSTVKLVKKTEEGKTNAKDKTNQKK